MRRKLMRIGNSFGVIFTKDILAKLNADYGDTFDMEWNELTGEVIIRKVESERNRNIPLERTSEPVAL
ncbi:AbrB/MazE/SpoVT family DNA-binding domain-containing protein [Paenibacillus sp. 481]|uniref:AbrB/MazE/SpoVT family DNA-binding domain-containing protein n=1 Tax=Paenibacillus sp. 481 TaxID=2835869 RepID=UPI001E44B52F|nr:AbrB/MazE/SpoVT family DNA-binding domain-containing protein [Paenibacillus sp. 481]UHA75636.1 AbrB/MazE/SpoVT family DNA-binding domain-containing protein [Paenibacillus sp. 481]